jgi:hypothetical protein
MPEQVDAMFFNELNQRSRDMAGASLFVPSPGPCAAAGRAGGFLFAQPERKAS